MHICVSRLTITGSDNGLSPRWRQAIIWTNAGILLIGPLGTNFIENLIGILTFSFSKMRLKVSSAKWRPFCLGKQLVLRFIMWIQYIEFYLKLTLRVWHHIFTLYTWLSNQFILFIFTVYFRFLLIPDHRTTLFAEAGIHSLFNILYSNTSRREKMAAILQTTHSNVFS